MTDDLVRKNFGLRGKPFSMTPDPDFLYWSAAHRNAHTVLNYGLLSGAPITVLTGEIGTGKTTLIRKLLNDMSEDMHLGLVSNAHRDRGNLLHWILNAFDIPLPAGGHHVAEFRAFQDHLVETFAKGTHTVLVIDEAQTLGVDQLEELRMLTNVNSGKDDLLQLILVGQPELREILSAPQLTQFSQRISAFFHLRAMTPIETESYIRHRLVCAGGTGEEIDAAAIARIVEMSGCIPRLVNRACDLSMVYAAADSLPKVTEDLVSAMLADGLFLTADRREPKTAPSAGHPGDA
ncbi:ExeA family protein [Roseivivax sediminis]|uniref:Type II secretory pathway, component ExeA (Predicted ATPase) n=1 Tax=Roseivivax sediminis TaxID=936889 RepID=A0A1I2DE02_9RHOB|nr:AAA family ATPase [Roseivivax sediminis]SFE78776.1 Type II secretory pathway, component ExeA (predicted ATPase) [Roseivivax sediminis]